MGPEFPLRVMTTFWSQIVESVVHYEWTECHVIVQGKMVNFMSCELYHNKNDYWKCISYTSSTFIYLPHFINIHFDLLCWQTPQILFLFQVALEIGLFLLSQGSSLEHIMHKSLHNSSESESESGFLSCETLLSTYSSLCKKE